MPRIRHCDIGKPRGPSQARPSPSQPYKPWSWEDFEACPWDYMAGLLTLAAEAYPRPRTDRGPFFDWAEIGSRGVWAPEELGECRRSSPRVGVTDVRSGTNLGSVRHPSSQSRHRPADLPRGASHGGFSRRGSPSACPSWPPCQLPWTQAVHLSCPATRVGQGHRYEEGWCLTLGVVSTEKKRV